MEDIHSSASEILSRIGIALKGERGTDIADSLREVLNEFTDRVKSHPFQALGTAAALGYVFAKTTRSEGQVFAPRLIGKGLGSLAALAFLEYVSKKGARAERSGKVEYHH